MKTSKLIEIIKLNPGLSYSASDYSDSKNDNVFINLKCIQRGGGFSRRGIKYYKGDYKDKHIVKQGDLIIAVTDLTKDAQLVGSPLFLPYINTKKPILISMDLASISVDENVLTKEYLAYYLMRPQSRQYMKENSRGTTVLHLDKDAFLNFSISYPEDINEQRRITNILTCLDSNVDGISQEISKIKEIKVGVLNNSFKDKNWVPLSGKVDIVSGSSFPISLQKEKTKEFKFIRVSDMNLEENKVKITKSNNYVSSKTVKEKKYKCFPKGCVIFPKVGATLLTNKRRIICDDRTICDNNIMGFLSKGDDLNNLFLYYFMTTVDMANYVQTGAVPSINNSIVNEIKMPELTIEEQTSCAKLLSLLDERIDFLYLEKSKMEKIKKGLLNDLL